MNNLITTTLAAALLTSAGSAQWTEIGAIPVPSSIGGNRGKIINDLGVILVKAYAAWVPSSPNATTGTIVPAPDGFLPRAVNNAGLVVGHAQTSNGVCAAIWDIATGSTMLLSSVGASSAYDVTDTQLVMTSSGVVDLATLQLVTTRTGFVNDYGQVVGVNAATNRIELWTPTSPGGSSGTVTDLGDAGGANADYVTDFNNYGQVLMRTNVEMLLWTPTTPNGSVGSAMPVPTPESGAPLYSPRINDRGQVLYTWYSAGTAHTAWDGYLWTPLQLNGHTGYLFKLGFPTRQGTTLQMSDLNDAGQACPYNLPYLWSPTSSEGTSDVLEGGSGIDAIFAGAGDDTVQGKGGDDYLDGEDGNDAILGGSGADVLIGGSGNDSLDGGSDADSLDGGDGDDVLDGGNGDDVLSGGAGDDLLQGGQGDDQLFGGAGDDCLDCSVQDGQGNDLMDGGDGNDVLIGGQGADEMLGGAGDDFIDGRSGDDHVVGGLGLDEIDAGSGADRITLAAGDVPAGQTESIEAGTGSDTLELSGFAASDVTVVGNTVTVSDPVTGGQFIVHDVETVVFL